MVPLPLRSPQKNLDTPPHLSSPSPSPSLPFPTSPAPSCEFACMARGRGVRPRSRRMRRGGQMPVAGGAIIKPHGWGKPDGRAFPRRGGDGSLGQIVNPGGADSKVQQPKSVDSASEGWIYVRGHRIDKAGLRMDCHGNVYVPDSEGEESSTEDADACGLHVAAGMDLAMDLTPQLPKALGAELLPDGEAVVDGVVDQAHEHLLVKESPVVATNKDVPPEVPEQLKEVLPNLDPPV